MGKSKNLALARMINLLIVSVISDILITNNRVSTLRITAIKNRVCEILM